GNTPYSYSWSPYGGTRAIATGLSADTYTVTITHHHGCPRTTSVTITQPASPLVESITVNNNISCFGQSNGSATVTALGGTSPYAYSWSNGHGSNNPVTGLS